MAPMYGGTEEGGVPHPHEDSYQVGRDGTPSTSAESASKRSGLVRTALAVGSGLAAMALLLTVAQKGSVKTLSSSELAAQTNPPAVSSGPGAPQM